MMDMYKRLRPFLTDMEYEECIEEAMILEEDLTFFQIYIKRNKRSKAEFKVVFKYGCNPDFFNLVDTGDYSAKKLQKTMAEYKILEKLVEQIAYESELYYYENQMISIYDYFEDEYEINLEKILDSFIGSSYLASKIVKKMEEIRELWEKES